MRPCEDKQATAGAFNKNLQQKIKIERGRVWIPTRKCCLSNFEEKVVPARPNQAGFVKTMDMTAAKWLTDQRRYRIITHLK